MNKELLLSGITKLEKGLTNKHITDAQKEGMKKKLEELKAKLEEQENEDSQDSNTEENPSEVTVPDKKSAPKAQKQIEVKAKKKPKEHKEAFKSDCAETIAQIRLLLDGHTAKKPAKKSRPATKKRTSEILSDGFASVFVRAVKTQLKLDKVGNIKLPKLREARDKMIDCLEAFRIGFGGAISKNNEQFIEDFTAEVNKIFDEVEEKQKKVTETKQAA